jgi:uncharacterized protein (TIGR00299 family) protein
MNLAYFEMIGGASGNMLLGALVHAGADVPCIEKALRTIPVPKPWTMRRDAVVKKGIAATLLTIAVPGENGADDHGRTRPPVHGRAMQLREIMDIVARSGLSDLQKSRACGIYERLAMAEARAHGVGIKDVHFHEVGETDAILDVAGTCVALDLLEIDALSCSAFPVGRGLVPMHHGLYPNPPPATAELLRGFVTVDGAVSAEMVTPTGAAILTSLADPNPTRPTMRTERIGYGAGTSDFEIPNVVRVSIGTPVDTAASLPETVAVLETNIDDMSPQYFEVAMERVFAAGAMDAWLAPITMKKSRPGILFGVIAPLERERACAKAMLAETTTLGVRVRREVRFAAERPHRRHRDAARTGSGEDCAGR